MEWYVLRWDFNSKQVVKYNIFAKDSILDLKSARKNKRFTNREELKQYLKRDFQYHYWCKSECEMVVGGLFHHTEKELEKIDIYRQLEPNLDRITDYVISACKFRF